jgi:hypothetical protein
MIELKKISETISKAYEVDPTFAGDMNRALEQYAEYYYNLFEKEWIPKNKNEKYTKKT